jgi:(R,R)-butanediol dehydrogenase / meso-butanediol dehydrogenase / diacetyl reductase
VKFAIDPVRVVAHLPQDLTLEEGASLENFGVAVHAVELSDLIPGDVAVVIGAGPIGIMIAQALKPRELPSSSVIFAIGDSRRQIEFVTSL